MIEELKDTPNTMVGFSVKGSATIEDFNSVVLPAVAELVKRTDKLNYLLIVDDPAESDTIAAWLEGAMTDLNNHRKWNKGAIVTTARKFSPVHSQKTTPGEFRTFSHTEIDRAIDWVGEQRGPGEVQVFAQEGEQED
jgi:hypothetical protein